MRSRGDARGPETFRQSGRGTVAPPAAGRHQEAERYHQDTLPDFGLLLDRHVLIGGRPPPGAEATTVCGRNVTIRPAPLEIEPGVPAVGARDCLDCQDVLRGTPREALSDRGAPPLLPARLSGRFDVVGTARWVVHLCSLTEPDGVTVTTRCGIDLPVDEIETVDAGEGMPCTACLLAAETPAAQQATADRLGRAARC
ncbi:hypothetical protein FHR81_003475 [Actinoalloteichus hoggarensis]|uniref:Uncharacterized protein n=1 Tax=Actinoalloteichus hoggarensis TaxID=1470176 RepID=A0A221W7U1_9PSEU|nr:hypothetical protein [Actinoalloteichus hoggarensis]ASO21824.1 hypothetical protein AHOG_21040 [Actinoalloteichus hoggarensis]MBB5922423.1 hypothetical protein [Actinoalloteichus hoggarensis]